jgi:membrane-associated protein
MTRLLDHLLNLHGVVVYLLVGVLVFAEDALFFGFVVPGETAAILGGVAASRGHASVAVMCIVVVAAAISGDSVGYEIGARYGTRVSNTGPLRTRRKRIETARRTLRRRGGPALFLGRFVALLRTVMPFLAGTSGMPYRTFLAYNAAGGLGWGIGSVLLGFLAGNSYAAIENVFGRTVPIVVGVIVVAGLAVWRIRRHRHA